MGRHHGGRRPSGVGWRIRVARGAGGGRGGGDVVYVRHHRFWRHDGAGSSTDAVVARAYVAVARDLDVCEERDVVDGAERLERVLGIVRV